MALIHKVGTGLLFSTALAGCKLSSETPVSATKDFAFNPNARNFAILAGNDGSFIGSPLGGVPTDIQSWWDLLCTPRAGGTGTGTAAGASGGQAPQYPANGVRALDGGGQPVTCDGILGKFEIIYANKAGTTVADVKAALAFAIKNATEDSTVLLAYSGHGTQGAQLALDPRPEKDANALPQWPEFNTAALEASKANGNKKVARFYFFNDSCFSGKLVNDGQNAVVQGGKASNSDADGQILPLPATPPFKGKDPDQSGIALTENTNKPLPRPMTPLRQKAYDQRDAMKALLPQDGGQTGWFVQGIVFSAANKSQTAGDLGAGAGGAFTARLKQAIEHYRNQYNPNDPTTNPTIQRVFNAVVRLVEGKPIEDNSTAIGAVAGGAAAAAASAGGTPDQVPVYVAAPECVLNEFFFLSGKPSVCAKSGTSTTSGTATGTTTGTTTASQTATATSTGARPNTGSNPGAGTTTSPGSQIQTGPVNNGQNTGPSNVGTITPIDQPIEYFPPDDDTIWE